VLEMNMRETTMNLKNKIGNVKTVKRRQPVRMVKIGW
jgi:hypothetical protein